MRSLKENLLVQFSVIGLLIVIAIGLGFSILSTKELSRVIDLLKFNNAAVQRGVALSPTDPISIRNITKQVDEFRLLSLGAVGAGFVLLYVGLVGIVGKGWRTITNQRRELESANAELETRVAERVEELRDTNLRLQAEIEERGEAQAALGQTNLLLEQALTDLRKAQQQVVQQERMRALGQMSSGIAHDFNNALGPIVAYLDLMRLVPNILENKEQVNRYLETMHVAATDAANVVKRLREFYRERDEDQLAEDVDVNEVVKQSLSLTQPRWRDQALGDGITIDIETDLQQVPLIASNASDLREMLTNLIINAVDAMPTGGSIYIGTRQQGEHVFLEVADEGVGMSEEVRSRCMEPFFSSKGERGSGLGLSMVYGIVRRHNGGIEIESEEGKGTTFTIRLPFRPRDQVSPRPEQKVTAAPVSSLRILLADDDPLGRDALAAFLSADGHTVDSVASGAEALKEFEAGKYDLVVTDRAMRHMNGDQLAAAIKEIAPHQQVIMATGFGDIMDSLGEKVPNVDLVLSKPVTLERLRSALATVVRYHAAQPQ